VREIYPLLFKAAEHGTRRANLLVGMILLHDETGKFAPFDVFKNGAVSRPAVGGTALQRAAELGDPLATFLSGLVLLDFGSHQSPLPPDPDAASDCFAHALDRATVRRASYWRLHTNRLSRGERQLKIPPLCRRCVDNIRA